MLGSQYYITGFLHFFFCSFGPEIIGAGFDPKEPKGQDTAKLPPHKAGRWPAAVSTSPPSKLELVIRKSSKEI